VSKLLPFFRFTCTGRVIHVTLGEANRREEQQISMRPRRRQVLFSQGLGLPRSKNSELVNPPSTLLWGDFCPLEDEVGEVCFGR